MKTIEAGGVFITERTRGAIHEAAARRTDEEMQECFKSLYDSMDQFRKQIETEYITGKNFIIYTPERKIGKTEASLELAYKYKMPYLIKSDLPSIAKQQAKRRGYNIEFITLAEARRRLIGNEIRIIIKDECVSTKEARRCIEKNINIIGIEQF